MRLDHVDARRREPLGFPLRLLRRRDVEAAEPDLHGPASGRAGQVGNPRPAHEHSRSDHVALVDAVADGEDRFQRRAQIDGGRDAGHQQLPRGDLHHPRHHRVAAVAVDPGEPGVVAAVAEHDEMAVGFNQARQHRATAGVHDRGVGGNLDLGRRSGRDDLAALDHHRGVVNRWNLVPGQQHAADQRDSLRRLRVRRRDAQRAGDACGRDEGGQQSDRACADHRAPHGGWCHAHFTPKASRTLPRTPLPRSE